jgi:thiol-disulfide isomerase/thioredoxin
MIAEGEKTRMSKPLRRFAMLGGAVALLAALGGVYGIVASRGNASSRECPDTQAAAARVDKAAKGELAALRAEKNPKPLPQLSFADAAGTPKSLADWRGKVVLFNLWATWCVPCRKEMPALDELQTKLGGADFEVVAVNIDTRNLDKAKTWLNETGIKRLAYFADPSAKVFQELKSVGKAFGMPTTLLVDRNGCEIASLAGPAEWASEDGLAVIRAALGRS